MRRKVSLNDQLYRQFYPAPKPDDHASWSAVVRKELAREARSEARQFYGEDYGTVVLQPGIDYTGLHARRRLGRFPFHAKLFAALDALALTPSEIYTVCSWDCSKFARDIAQTRHPNSKIDDDTGDDVPTWEEVAAERELARAVEGESYASLANLVDCDELGIDLGGHYGIDDDDDDDDDEAYVAVGHDVEMEDQFQLPQPPPAAQGTPRSGSDSLVDAPLASSDSSLVVVS